MSVHGNGGFKLIRAARLIDGNGGSPLERGAILIEGDVIRAVGTEDAVVPPEGARVEEISYEDATVLPGLIDCHVHLVGIGDGRAGDDLNLLPDEVLTLQAARNARAHLYSGVTTVRDCGGKNQTTFMLRKAMEMGITPGPRLVLSGRPVAIIGGHLGYFGIQATGTDECRAAVRQLVKEGADFIKVTATGGTTRTSYMLRPSFTVEELTAICDEAHKFGKHVAAHTTISPAIIDCLDAGVDTVLHGKHLEPDGRLMYREEITERIVEQGVFVNFNMYDGDIWALESKRMDEGLAPREQSRLDGLLRDREAVFEQHARMRDAGVRMASGSDSAWGVYAMGHFQREIEVQVEAGMSPTEAIVSATGDSARSCWIDDRVGTLEEGKQADLLVVSGDPSRDIAALNDVVDVFQAGSLIDRATE